MAPERLECILPSPNWVLPGGCAGAASNKVARIGGATAQTPGRLCGGRNHQELCAWQSSQALGSMNARCSVWVIGQLRGAGPWTPKVPFPKDISTRYASY